MVDCASVRILCIGDVVLDRFATGEVTCVSREAPEIDAVVAAVERTQAE